MLQEVTVPVIENKICETMYRSAGYIEHIPHIFICAGWKKGGYDSCEGKHNSKLVKMSPPKSHANVLPISSQVIPVVRW